jgi:hypothetical protein
MCAEVLRIPTSMRLPTELRQLDLVSFVYLSGISGFESRQSPYDLRRPALLNGDSVRTGLEAPSPQLPAAGPVEEERPSGLNPLPIVIPSGVRHSDPDDNPMLGAALTLACINRTEITPRRIAIGISANTAVMTLRIRQRPL